VKGLFARQAFTGFGSDGLLGDVPPPTVVAGRRPGRLRAAVREQCPKRPGVYGMIDAAGALVYVGKAKCLRSRLLSYFRPGSRDPKAGRILEATRRIAWEPGPSELAALLRELELIRRWRPRFNVQGQPRRRRRWYVCVGRRPAPYVFLAGRPPATAQAVFGPVPAGRTAREAVRRLNDWYRLRDCPQAQEMVFADQKELFPLLRAPGCLRHEIGSCVGPCAAACTRDEYAAHVEAALNFLRGADATPLEMLRRDMQTASAELAFERAAALRDRLEALDWLARHLEGLRRAAASSFVYPLTGTDGATLWYVVREGRVRAALRAEPGAADLAALAHGAGGPPTPDEVDGVLIVTSWFRRYPDERQKTRPWPAP
jgi:excinuclease ABC subunit C